MMTLEEEIADIFQRNEWTWKIKDKGPIIPDVDDVQATLDEAARLLYDRPVGTQIEIGRLIIIKTARAHDVYVLTGTYQ